MKIVISFLFIFGLVSCAVTPPPPTPEYNIPSGSKIGVLIDIGDKPFHKHVGTTIFNNFEKELNFDWEVKSTVEISTVEALNKAGYQVHLLSNNDFKAEDLAFLIIGKDKQWSVDAKHQASFHALKNELKLDALVIIREIPVTVISQCGAYGCTYFGSNKFGLFTRSFFGLDRYDAVHNFKVNVLLLNDLMNFGWGADIPGNETLSKEVDMEDPKDFEKITKEEIDAIKKEVVTFANNLYIPIIKILKK